MRTQLKKIIFSVFLLIFTLSFVPTTNVKAYVAWPDVGNAFLRTMLNEMWIQIRAAIIGALKKEAITMLSETINNLVAGTTQAGALFISDWEDYLFNTPSGNTASYMNDFFTVTTRGRSSGSYTSGACGGSFSEWRAEGAQESVNVIIDYTELQDDFQEYACDALSMFDDGTWAAFDAFMQPNNNPIAYQLIAEGTYSEKLRREESKASNQAQAYQGFVAQKDKNGIVLTPGSIIEGLTIAANTADNDAIANARNAGEIVGLVVGKIASGVIKNGIGNARKNAQSQINSCIAQGTMELSAQLKKLTPKGNLMGGGSGLGTLGGGSNSNKICK